MGCEKVVVVLCLFVCLFVSFYKIKNYLSSPVGGVTWVAAAEEVEAGRLPLFRNSVTSACQSIRLSSLRWITKME